MTNPSIYNEIKFILSDTLVTYESGFWQEDTLLLGNIPEFDSMAVVSLLNALEESFGFNVDDDEISADIFESIATLCKFVQMKTA
jgi:acyl carrier protein